MPESKFQAEVLSKILLIQNMLDKLPTEDAVFSFVSRGIEEMPGVERVAYSLSPVAPAPDTGSVYQLFPVYLEAAPIGYIDVRLKTPELFQPYSVYIHNICFMMAAIFRERRQKQIDARRKEELEQIVSERTAQLSELISREEAARQRAERYLTVAETIIVELDNHGRVQLINKRGLELLGYTQEEVLGRDWFDLVIPEEEREKILGVFQDLMTRRDEMTRYYENRIVTSTGKLCYISWNNDYILDDDGTIAGLLSSGQDMTERKAAEEQIQRGLNENQILLKELYHRTRNNMQVISGLLTLHASRISEPRLTAVLNDMNNRIHSIALIHQKLYESRDLSRLRLDEYIRDLTSLLIENYQVSSKRISLVLELDPIEVNIDTALPLGLLVNEILTNAVKHAFPDGLSGTITIQLREGKEDYIQLVIRDNGAGIPPGTDFSSLNGSLGGYLIKTITEYQLSGSLKIETNQGTTFRIHIPNKNIEVRV